METPKYYTPQIEEFHVGFEFEVKNSKGEWDKIIIDTSICDRQGLVLDIPSEDEYGYNPINIRVKHLDREDIESEGWKFVDSVFGEYCLNDKYYLSYINNTIKIGYDEGFQTWIEICLGVPCKNKSELKKLMKQLDISLFKK